ncbi:MAG: Ribonuclease VapC2 [Planctomycetes bacterium]|nr:Ribonuclease VapC2 [Planctomycetota bacterium]
MKYVLDTNAVSALMRGEPNTIARIRAAAPDELGVPHVVLAEIEFGIRRLPRSRRRRELEHRLDLVKHQFARPSWTDDVAARFGEFKAKLERQGVPIEDMDLLIAAHASVLDAVLVTSNTRHFSRIAGLKVEDWTQPA